MPVQLRTCLFQLSFFIIVPFLYNNILILFFAVVLATAILNSRSMNIKYYEIMNQLNEYMRQKRLPQNLKKKFLDYYKFKYQKKYFKEQMITTLLPGNFFQFSQLL